MSEVVGLLGDYSVLGKNRENMISKKQHTANKLELSLFAKYCETNFILFGGKHQQKKKIPPPPSCNANGKLIYEKLSGRLHAHCNTNLSDGTETLHFTLILLTRVMLI